MKTQASLLLSIILGILLIIFGLNKFLGFIAVQPPADAVAQGYLGSMFTSYLYILVGFAEIVGGILLIFHRTRLLGWLVLLPVLVNIILFHLAHDFVGNGIWIVPTLLFLAITLTEKERIGNLLKL